MTAKTKPYGREYKTLWPQLKGNNISSSPTKGSA
jgi:hypothetical protein